MHTFYTQICICSLSAGLTAEAFLVVWFGCLLLLTLLKVNTFADFLKCSLWDRDKTLWSEIYIFFLCFVLYFVYKSRNPGPLLYDRVQVWPPCIRLVLTGLALLLSSSSSRSILPLLMLSLEEDSPRRWSLLLRLPWPLDPLLWTG